MDIQETEVPTLPSHPTVPNTAPTKYKDRYTGLCVFAVMEIIGGLVAALMIPATVFFMTSKSFPRPSGTEMPMGIVVLTSSYYAEAAIVFTVLGVGALRARRWAWALNLILSWLSVFASTLLVLLSLVGGFGPGALWGTLFFVPILVIGVLFLLFYREKDVELTFKQRDPVERWTDRRPLPVIAAALFFLWSGAMLPSSFAFSSPPSFGHLTGYPASAVLFVRAGAEVYAAVAMMKLRVSGWWIALATEVTGMASTLMFLGRGTDAESLARSGLSKQQLEFIQQNSGLITNTQWTSLAFPVASLVFLLWLRRYFPRKVPAKVESEALP